MVIDASIAIKWVVTETGWEHARALRQARRLAAPDLLVAECANVLWKKVRRRELTDTEAEMAAGLLERSDVELFPMRNMLRLANRMAVRLAHPAYDCMYITLAVENGWTFVTADESLIRKLRQRSDPTLAAAISTLAEAVQ